MCTGGGVCSSCGGVILLVFVVDDLDDIFGYEDQGYPSIFDCTHTHTTKFSQGQEEEDI